MPPNRAELDVNDVVKITGFSRNTVLRLIAAGKLRHRRTKPFSGHYRFKPEWIEEMLQALEQGGEAYGKKAA
jgi:hypothetical protein